MGSFDELTDRFGDKIPDIEKLADTPQDPQWHAEGDVETHTRMVLDEAEGVLESSSRGYDEDLLRLAAFFHDVGKVSRTRTRVVDGEERIVSPGHASEGRDLVATHLIDELDRRQWWKVQRLVRNHHDPKRIVEIDDPVERGRKLKHLSRIADPVGLYLLELADVKGRECLDRETQIEKIELFRLYCEDEGVWDGTDPYDAWDERISEELRTKSIATCEMVRAEARYSADRGDIFCVEEALAQSYQYRYHPPSLILLCGPSGSGKSTYHKRRFRRFANTKLISLDHIREEIGGSPRDHSNEGKVRQRSKKRLKQYLADNQTVVWDATNLRRDFRRNLISLAYAYGTFVTLVVFCTPPRTCISRNADRENPVPGGVLDRQLSSWEFPGPDEAHVVEYVDSEDDVFLRCIGGKCEFLDD